MNRKKISIFFSTIITFCFVTQLIWSSVFGVFSLDQKPAAVHHAEFTISEQIPDTQGIWLNPIAEPSEIKEESTIKEGFALYVLKVFYFISPRFFSNSHYRIFTQDKTAPYLPLHLFFCVFLI